MDSTIKQLETKLEQSRLDNQSNLDKLIAAENEKSSLHSKLASLQAELDFGREQMLRRSEEYESAVEALAKAHRESEDGRLAALQELEKRKYDIADLEVKNLIFFLNLLKNLIFFSPVWKMPSSA